MNAKEAAELAEKNQLDTIRESIAAMAKNGYRYTAMRLQLLPETVIALEADGFKVVRNEKDSCEVNW
jgi:hypothetical protein